MKKLPNIVGKKLSQKDIEPDARLVLSRYGVEPIQIVVHHNNKVLDIPSVDLLPSKDYSFTLQKQ